MSKWMNDPPGSDRWRKDLWHAGRRLKLTCRGTKKEAQEYEARKRLALGATGVIRERDVPTFESACVDVYKPFAKAHLRPTTWNVRRYQLEPIIAHFGALKLTRITETHVEAYKLARLKSVGKVTINGELNVLSAVLTYARELQTPCATIKIRRFKVRPKKGNVKFYTRTEVGFILAACAEVAQDFLPMVTFIFETGARRSEAINLPWANVDFDRRLLRIWSEASSDGEESDDYLVKSVEREVTISDHLARVLKAQKLRGLSKEWVFPAWKNNCDTKGERYANFPKHTWTRVLVRATALAQKAAPKAPAITGGPHRARHTFASHFLAEKPDLFMLGRLLGHSHSRVTELYAHLVPEHLAETRNVVTFAHAKVAPSKSSPRAVAKALPPRRSGPATRSA